MEFLSYKFLGNSELIKIILVCTSVSFLTFIFFKYALKTKKYLPISIITICYSIISLWNLGSTKFPKTQWQPIMDNQEIIFEVIGNNKINKIYAVYGIGDTNNNPDTYQIGSENIYIYGSNDNLNYSLITDLNNGSIYQYIIRDVDVNYKYIKIVATEKNSTLNEILFKNNENILKLKILSDIQSKYPASLLIDEQNLIPNEPTYFDEGFFDEVYHPRNAEEIVKGQYMYPSVHPLFGTTIIAFFIKLFGLSPFAWRIGGAIFGIMMVPLIYLICKKLFNNEYLSNVGAILFCCDFMHITTSRIGTLEPFSVFFILLMSYFMILYCYENNFKKELKYLAFCGVAMGFGWSSKWTVIYSSIGLAIIFFKSLFTKNKNKFIKTILWCILWFIVIPSVIYYFSFFMTKIYRTNHFTISNIINHNINMYNYHKNLKATHPFQSVWYEWLLNLKPIWYYSKTLNDNSRLTISCFSNPVISYAGIISLICTFYLSFRYKIRSGFIISISFLSAILPWVFIDRCLFSYHFYPSTPFLILSIIFCLNHLMSKYNIKKLINIFVFVCIFVFIMFLPVICGFKTTSFYYNNFLTWFSTWYFGA